jgi:dTDP-glucose 4,6-dehydratase
MIKLLVTGGAGFIGSNFVHYTLKNQPDYHITVIDKLTYAGNPDNLKLVLDKVKFITGDICDADLMDKLVADTDIVVHFAAESHNDNSLKDPWPFLHSNLVGTFTVLEAVRKHGKRLHHISTDEVYGSLGPTGYFSETTPYQPNSPYSASKASSDMLTRAWHHTFGLPTLTTNCSNNYGPRQFPEKLIPHMIECALAGKPLPIYGDGKNVRDWIHVQDHCRGILLALEKGTRGATYCFGGNAERNNLDVVHGICDHLDRLKPRADGQSYRTQMKFVEDRLGHDRRYAIDDSLAVKTLGFKREFQFETGLENTVRWYLEHRDWVKAVQSKGGKK